MTCAQNILHDFLEVQNAYELQEVWNAKSRNTGMRLGEILSLRRQDIDLRTGMIAILDSKNGSGRSIPMDAVVRELLGQYPRAGASDLIFTNAAGKRFKDIRTAFRNACRRAGLMDFHFHDLRHTFASHWMMSGGDLYTLSKILGHKTIHMTQRYAHFEFQQKVVDRLDNIWNRGADGSSATSDSPPEQFPVTPRSQAVDKLVPEEMRHAKDTGSGHVN
jgi:integrase